MRTSRTFSIHFWINLAKKKDNTAPIYARVTVDGGRAEISLKRRTSVTYWDTKSKRTTERTPKGKALNLYLDQVHAKILQCHQQLNTEDELITAKLIKARFVGHDERHKTLIHLIAYHNENMVGVLKHGTMKNYFTTEKYVKIFLVQKKKTKDIYLKHLNYSFIIDFEQFLRKTKSLQKNNPLSNNGIMKHLERLKKLLNLATDLDWVEKNPFNRYKLKFQKYEKAFLTKQELDMWTGLVLNSKKLENVKDIFQFACYTGLSYIDVKNLTQNNLVQGIDGEKWIFTNREKNDQPVKIPLLKPSQFILEKYKDYSNLNNDKLLPVFSNQKINAYLKEITRKLNIDKNITFHSARHTFATTVTLSNGVPIETVSKLLGHSKISTTQVYARVLENKISSDMNILKKSLDKPKKTHIQAV